MRPGVAGRGSKNALDVDAVGGISPIASTPSRSSCQKLAASSTPPGKRQPMPTMATARLTLTRTLRGQLGRLKDSPGPV